MNSRQSDSKSNDDIRPATGAKRVVFLGLAGLFFTIGILGLAVPGLPGTPFFLLTSFFLVRASPALNDRLLNSRLIGPMLTDWQVNGGVRTHVKIKAISAVTLIIALTLYFSSFALWIKTTIVLLALVGILVIWCLPNVD
ncbi:MAG: YbaN family protein, partial [Planctomycetota bacterium]